ncbi:MAG TPA: serine/threonine-protein kinase [Kofleriaceae bacterium]|nr:serine/threonine-protein kinase [Kofleriaceae bacterium]
MRFSRGRTFAGYRIIERLGTTVLLVEDDRGHQCVLRFLGHPSSELVARCFTDACNASQVDHVGVARTYDVGFDGQPFIISELVDGDPLARRIARGPLALSQALVTAQRIAQVLAALHERGIAHGSLTPSNIFLGEDIKLTGFGLAALGGGDAMGCVEHLEPPTYTAPEQCRAWSSYDARSDLYALGCILHEMIAGRPPFATDQLGELVTSHLMASPPPLASAPAAVRDLVAALLAKDPADRPSATYVQQTIDGVLGDLEVESLPRAPWRWIAALAVSVSLLIPSGYTELSQKLQDVFHAVDLPSLPL